jgi:prepilin-type N-terminal cleavage/methylation domain-containing protein
MPSRHSRGFTLVELMLCLGLACVAVIFGYGALGRVFVDNKDAVRAAESFGMTEVKITSRKNVLACFRGCGSDDDVAFDLKAKNAQGADVDLKVCCGAWFKGCTVRTP